MYALLIVLHMLICLALIGVVLIQSGKGGGLAGGAFGGSAQTVFGGRGATDIVTRATMVLGGLFFVTSLVLALMTTGQRGSTRSLIQNEARRAASTPAAPGSAPSQTPPVGGGTAPAPTGGTAPAPTGGTAPAPTGGQPAPTSGTPSGGR